MLQNAGFGTIPCGGGGGGSEPRTGIIYSGNFILKKFRPWYLASEIFRNVYSILKSSIEKNTCPIEILHDFPAKIVW